LGYFYIDNTALKSLRREDVMMIKIEIEPIANKWCNLFENSNA